MAVVEGRLYTREELLAAARERRVTASVRLIADWVELGLLDHPVKKGLGRAKGTRAGWPEEQYRLWLVLLTHRPTVQKVATLANIPVGLWLYFGDTYAPLRQVRRALRTWSGAYGRVKSYTEFRTTARRFLAMLPDVRVPKDRRAAVLGVLAEVLCAELPGPEQAEDVRARLLDAISDSAEVSHPLFNTEAMIDVILARLEALRQLDRVPSQLFSWARVFLLTGLAGYARDYPELAWEGHRVSGTAPLTVETLFQHACLDLITVLGHGLTVPNARPDGDARLTPALWTASAVTSRVRTEPIPSPLILPNGRHPLAGLQFNITTELAPGRGPNG